MIDITTMSVDELAGKKVGTESNIRAATFTIIKKIHIMTHLDAELDSTLTERFQLPLSPVGKELKLLLLL